MKVYVPEYVKNAYKGTEIKRGKWTKVKIYKQPYIFFHVNDPLEWSADVWKWTDENHVERITDIDTYGRLVVRANDDLKKFLDYVTDQLKRHKIKFPEINYTMPAQGWYQSWNEVEES